MPGEAGGLGQWQGWRMAKDDAAPAGLVRLADVPAVRMGDLELTPALLRVTGPVGVTETEPLVMRLLLLLAESPGRVLAREAILSSLWPGTTVGDDSLHRAVAQARRALAACGTTAIIETVPRTGYRLEPGAAAAPVASAPADPGRRKWLIAAGLAGAAAAGGALWWRRAGPPPREVRVAAMVEQSRQLARLAEPVAERQGAGLLKAAAQAAPDDAEIWGLLALAMRDVAEFSPPGRVTAALAEAEAAAKRALAIDPGQADARAAMVLLQPIHGNWWAAEQGFRAILADAPDHLPSLDGLSQVQAGAGLIARHYPLRKRTVALDPLHAGYNFRSVYAHWMNGNLAAADRAGALGLEYWPRHGATWFARMGLFAFSGRPDRALAMLDDEATRPPLPPPFLALWRQAVAALADGGEADRQRAAATWEQVLANDGPLAAVGASMMLAALNMPDRSLAVVEGYLLERGPARVDPNWKPGQILHNDVRRRFTNFMFTPVMAPVWKLPGFDALTRAIGLEDYWRQSGHAPDFRAVAGRAHHPLRR